MRKILFVLCALCLVVLVGDVQTTAVPIIDSCTAATLAFYGALVQYNQCMSTTSVLCDVCCQPLYQLLKNAAHQVDLNCQFDG